MARVLLRLSGMTDKLFSNENIYQYTHLLFSAPEILLLIFFCSYVRGNLCAYFITPSSSVTTFLLQSKLLFEVYCLMILTSILQDLKSFKRDIVAEEVPY